MRILEITRDYLPATGGMERRAYEISHALARAGHQVLVLAPHGSASESDRVALRTYALLSSWRAAGWWLRVRILGALLAFRPEVILANTWSPCGWAALPLAKLLRVPLFITAHGLDILEPLRKAHTRAFELRTLTAAAGVIAVSHCTKDLLVRSGLLPEKIRIVPNGVDIVRFSPQLSGNGWKAVREITAKQVILTVARLEAHKGHTDVLYALVKLIERGYDFHYVIAGGGPARADLEQRIRDLQLENHVTLAGEVSEAELPLVYAAADVVVMPSFAAGQGTFEGFGIAYLEGSATGKPVIGCRDSGAADAIVDGETGFLIPPRDPDALAAKLAWLADHPAEAAALGRAGRERVEREFAWDRITKKLLAVIESGR